MRNLGIGEEISKEDCELNEYIALDLNRRWPQCHAEYKDGRIYLDLACITKAGEKKRRPIIMAWVEEGDLYRVWDVPWFGDWQCIVEGKGMDGLAQAIIDFYFADVL